jgi:hypothetical protein
MIKVRGITYYSLQEIADRLRVHPKTLNDWIAKKIIPPPEISRIGKHRVPTFTDRWLRQARKSLLEHQKESGSTPAILAALTFILPDEPLPPIAEEPKKEEK